MAQKKTTSSKKAASSRPSSARKAAVKKAPAKKAGGSKKTAKKAAPVKKVAKKAASAQKLSNKKFAKKAAPAQKLSKKAAPAKKAQSQKAQSQKTSAKSVTAGRVASAKDLAKKAPATVQEAPKKIPARVEEPPPPPPKPVKTVSRYGVGDKVVHPQHGAATIAKRVKREFAGVVRDYYVLDISTESLTVMVPVDKVDSVVRSVISKAQSRNVLNSLKDEAQEAGANWSRWYKVLTEKMYSGDIFQVAEVVRDLSFAQQTKGISPALKRMLSKARMTLISELSFSLEVDEEEATRRLDKAVPKVENPLVPAT